MRRPARRPVVRRPSTIVITGAGVDDMTYDCDLGTWNVTRAQRDCDAGRHGPPWAVDTQEAIGANAAVERDPAKVLWFTTMPEVLEIPGISVMADGKLWLIEGHHRLAARHMLQMPLFATFVIEEGSESEYRVLFNGRRHLPHGVVRADP